MKHLLSLIALAATASVAAAAPTNLLTNGSFESTSVADGSWVNVASIEGWTRLAGPGTGIEVRNNVAGAAQDGRNFIELDTNGNTTLGQTLLGLSAGASYDLSFWYSPRMQQSAATNGLEVFWNGTLLGATITGTGNGSNDWAAYSFQVTAAAGPNLLSFASVGNSDSLGAGLDNVWLTASAVPEPTTWLLTLAGLGAIGAARRRRAAA